MVDNLVSIITPCYNSEKFIADTIISIQNQTYSNWELLITDDGSTDRSINIIEEFIVKDHRIKLFKIKNGGAAVARNHSIKQAVGKYIAFLDSDDLWLPKKLEYQIDFMIRNNYSFTHTSYQLMNQKGDLLNNIRSVKHKLNYKNMLTSNKIGCLTAVYDQQMMGKIYMPLIRKRQDYALWLLLLKKVKYTYGLDEILATYRVHDLSMSSKKTEMIKWNWKLFREVERKNIFISVILLMCNIVNKVRKF